MHSGLSQAFLITGWLSHVLHWVLVHPLKATGDDGEYLGKFRSNEQAITVRVQPALPRETHPGGIESMILHSTLGGKISYRTTEREDCLVVKSSLSGEETLETVISIHHQTEAELVSRELEVLYNDPMFESSMLALAAILLSGTQ